MRDPDKLKAWSQSYYAANREARKDYARQYYEQNREAILAKRREKHVAARNVDADRAQRLAEIRARNGAKMRAAMGIAS